MAMPADQPKIPDKVWDALYADADAEALAPRASRQPTPPSEHRRLMMAALMAFIKGAVVSAVAVAPFLGIWPAVGTTLAFTLFCVWLAHKKGSAVGGNGADAGPRPHAENTERPQAPQ